MKNSDKAEILELHNKYVLGTYPPSEAVIDRGAMSWLWDADGNRFLDFTSGISVCNLGHCHPRVTEAIQRQAARLVHVSNLFVNANQPRLAELISKRSFGGQVFFCNSGAEANEGMIKFARRWGHAQGRHEIITMESSFHGRTLATLAATGRKKYREGFQPDVEGFIHVPFNDLSAVENAITEQTAAVLVEPIQGEGGVIPANPDFMQGLRRICDEHNILLMLDEVQCGMGRTGEYFAYQRYGIEPDAMAMAKALANGFPIGAFEVKVEHADVLPPGTHATTFGGSPLACAAGIAVFETFEEETVLDNCQRMAALIWEQLHKLSEQSEAIKEVRGMGLMIGIDINGDAKEVLLKAREQGLLILTAGESVVRLLPPLTVQEEEANKAMAVLKDILG
ncbi:MAG: aspartate aminotransferase family protein [Lentisphaeria bacterium]